MALSHFESGKVGSRYLNAFVDALNTALSLLAPKASPAFTGVVTLPAVASGDSSTKAAPTVFVADALAGGLPLKLKTYTVAELPAAAGNLNQLVHVSNGSAGNPCIAISTGADWKVLAALGATVAAA